MQVNKVGEHLHLTFPYNEKVKDIVKIRMDGARWEPNSKKWAVKDTPRSRWWLDFLAGKNPFGHYDRPVPEFVPSRPEVRIYQNGMAGFCSFTKRCILAAEMGTGKTLTAIEVMEASGLSDWWFVAPKNALLSVKVDMKKWGIKLQPKLLTYEQLVADVTRPFNAPDGIIFDEASRVKNIKAQRTLAAMHVANEIRKKDGYIILMSGTPAPKSPVDWWALCEIVCPGFLAEGNIHKFLNRVAVVKQEEGISGVKYPKILTFKDNPDKCNMCGNFKDHPIHTSEAFLKLTKPDDYHDFVPSINEVALLHQRMKGLVKVVLKEDCLDLPEKVYRTIELTPEPKTVNMAKLITKSARNTAQALILLRELSDGFQYHTKLVGTETCEPCKGKGCIHCSNKGQVKVFKDEVVEIGTPKDAALREIMEDMESRLIVYAGFTGTIDKICKIVREENWDFIRVDGTGWKSSFAQTAEEMLTEFQDLKSTKRIVFVGHPKSAGMGLTLTASTTTLYYSNDFDGESRSQSEDRNHRIGSRGCNIIDLYHLPVDKLVCENLKNKRNLMLLTLGELDAAIT